MFKFVILIFALFVVKNIESSVIKYPLSADGLEIDFVVKNKDTVLWKMQIDVNEQDKTVRLTRSMPQAPAGSASGNPSTALPTIENRNSIKAGLCPSGYVKRGGFCFQDYDY